MFWEALTTLMIYFIIPLIGLVLFFKIRNKMIFDKIISPPIFDFFMIFLTYGGLLLIVLTSLLLKWSGMASLGTFYLILVAPFVMGFIAYKQYRKREESRYNKLAFKFGVLYYVIAPLFF